MFKEFARPTLFPLQKTNPRLSLDREKSSEPKTSKPPQIKKIQKTPKMLSSRNSKANTHRMLKRVPKIKKEKNCREDKASSKKPMK
jgi:hypothetical protein